MNLGFSAADLPSPEPTYTCSSCTLVGGLLAGRTIFLGAQTKQCLVHVVLFRLPHAPTRLPERDFD
jgi:hypothetical protein